LSYLIAIFLTFLSQTDYFVKDVLIINGVCHTKAQIGHHFYLIFTIIFLFLAIRNFLIFFKNQKVAKQKESIFIYSISHFHLDLYWI